MESIPFHTGRAATGPVIDNTIEVIEQNSSHWENERRELETGKRAISKNALRNMRSKKIGKRISDISIRHIQYDFFHDEFFQMSITYLGDELSAWKLLKTFVIRRWLFCNLCDFRQILRDE